MYLFVLAALFFIILVQEVEEVVRTYWSLAIDDFLKIKQPVQY